MNAADAFPVPSPRAAPSGTIAAATFLGERSHFHVKIPGRTEPIAVSGQAPAGESVSLEFPPEKLIALPATG